MADNKKVVLSLLISNALKREASILAARRGLSRSELVRRAVREYVDKYKAEAEEETS